MKNFHSKKSALAKRIKLSDGYRTAIVFENDLVEICGFSKSHANKIINKKQKLSDAHKELLQLKLLGKIPGWPPGWYVIDGEISCPNGYLVNSIQMENFSFFMSIMGDIHRDLNRLQEENQKLRKELKNSSEIRVYTNNSTKAERTIRLVKK
ncbi:hypothetical protein [Neptuniibacter halophilus]|uniref:hypothetical protein n=1 Tax=Neptuniibacter halophilus TaxID=651666 RepID=UPI002572F975|nr:hypothetical protein [Neptuniibacter halophilus]